MALKSVFVLGSSSIVIQDPLRTIYPMLSSLESYFKALS